MMKISNKIIGFCFHNPDKMLAFLVVLQIIFFLTGVWVSGSVITSGIKSASNKCGQEYKAEIIFSGDWFCPK